MFQKDFIWNTPSYFTELEIDSVKHTKFVVYAVIPFHCMHIFFSMLYVLYQELW